MKKAENSIQRQSRKAHSCPHRPLIHFIAPSMWLNDPNGTIFHEGYYHLFYQTNPFGAYWNHIHWGHARSQDLVHWEHLPLALAPQKNLGEHFCFSGCLVINQGVPTILYTSIKNLLQVRTGGETWGATSDENLIEWTRLSTNPVMPLTLIEKLQVHHWRDPYMWKSGDVWYAVMGGQLRKPKRGAVFLYQSPDLLQWEYLHPLAVGNKTTGKAWECPNFFKLGDKWVLIVSPFGKVIYTIGTFENCQFIHSSWMILDHSKNFYATNTLRDAHGRLILVGWIRGDKRWKQKKWQGCISLPKILSLDVKGDLHIAYVPQLTKLRDKHYNMRIHLLQNSKIRLETEICGQSVEIKVVFRLKDAKNFGISFFEDKNHSNPSSVHFNAHTKYLMCGRESAMVNFKSPLEILTLHIFIDQSVIELIINHKTCLTSRIYPKSDNAAGFSLFSENGSVLIESLDLWSLKPI